MRQIERSKTNKSYWTKMFLISIAALLVILGLRYGLYYGFGLKLETMFTPGIQQTEFPAQCSISTDGIATGNTYLCPSDASSCSVTVKLDCNTVVGNQQVIFRGSSQTGLPSQIAVDFNGNGAIESTEVYTRSTSYSQCISPTSNSIRLITYLPEPFQTNYASIYISRNQLSICQGSTAYNYVQGGTLSTSNVPLAGESCDGSSGFIRCLGSTNIYQCTTSTTGSVIKAVTYSGNAAGSKTEIITLQPGQTIGWAPGN